MFVNSFKINLNDIVSGTTATTINIPVNMEYQVVDQAELVNRVFVDVETKKAINPIIDYEKTRFTPINSNDDLIYRITYSLNLSGSTTGTTTYGQIGFTDDDIKFRKEVFNQTFLNLDFYDTDNPLTQNLVSRITLFSEIKNTDLITSSSDGIVGQTKPANQIPINFVLENDIIRPIGITEGYYLYDYKDETLLNQEKYLYMRASFKNAKSGTTTNMMVKNLTLPIDKLIHELYTRFKLIKKNNGYYYVIDDTYQGNPNYVGQNNNVKYTNKEIFVSLYKIKAL